jgi:hypothetical protein
MLKLLRKSSNQRMKFLQSDFRPWPEALLPLLIVHLVQWACPRLWLRVVSYHRGSTNLKASLFKISFCISFWAC